MKKLSETYKELGIAFSFPIEMKDANGKRTYYEDSFGFWSKREYDSNGKRTYYEDSEGLGVYWEKCEYDSDGNVTYYEDSEGFWSKREHNSNGNVTYLENGEGVKIGTPRSTTNQ